VTKGFVMDDERRFLKQLKPRLRRLRNSVHTWLDELLAITQKLAERSSRIDQQRSRHESRHFVAIRYHPGTTPPNRDIRSRE